MTTRTVQHGAPATVGVPWRAGAAVAAAGLAGFAAGVATSWLQGVLPDPVNFVANSGAAWSLLAFGCAVVVAGRRCAVVVTVAAGTAALVGEVLGYYAVASPLRDIPTTRAEQVLWVAAAGLVASAVSLAYGPPVL